LWCPRDRKFFENEKLFLRQTADSLIGAYEKSPMFCVDSAHSIIRKTGKDYNLKYLLALLNSTFGNYLYKLLITETGKVFAQVKLTFLRKIPIKNIDLKEQMAFVEIVDKILSITKSDDYLSNSAKQSEVHDSEQQIDQMVYKLYDLTPEEIKTVENNA
jgi:restriction endonuclease S subunit